MVRYARGPVSSMPYALCQIVPHVTEKGYSLSAQGKLVGSSASRPRVETNGGPCHKSGESLVGFNRMQAISTGVETNDRLKGSVQDIITTNF